jgi:hypothetical protein
VRPAIALLTLACCFAAASPAVAAPAAPPRYQLLGDWSFHGHRYRFVSHAGAIYGSSLASVRVGHCLERKGTKLFRGYRFRGTRGGVDYWRGKLAVVGRTCRRALVSSTITESSDLTFAESSRLPGGRRPPPSSFRRVRPPLSPTDPVLGTWVRNGAGLVVAQEGSLYVGRARESYAIANGCTVAAGTVVWRMRPVAPDRYSGTIQTFFGPPGCAPASLDKSTWVLVPGGAQLVRQAAPGQAFPYTRG